MSQELTLYRGEAKVTR